jgi:hypothetical protein
MWVQVPTVHGMGALETASPRSCDTWERLVMGLTYSDQYRHGLDISIVCTLAECGSSRSLWA